MTGNQKDLREIARKLLEEKKVDLIIGYGEGTVPLRSVPLFVQSAEEAERLIWNLTCENNLAKFLMKQRGKRIGIVVKGCDLRAIVEGIKENQIVREDVYLIGVGCRGLLNRKKLERHLAGRDLREGRVEGEMIIIRGIGFEEKLTLREFLDPSCATCRHPNPVLYDLFVGEKASQPETQDEFKEVLELEKMSAQERWSYFTRELSRCIRCYACREACPLCYCPECFVDCSIPSWVGKSLDHSDTMVYHVVRALHLAGRCVDCGACSRACPMNIELRLLNKKLEKEVRERFGYDAGVDLKETSALGTYRLDDAQEFIM